MIVLTNALSDENTKVKQNSAWALTQHYYGAEPTKVDELLNHDDPVVISAAAEVLRTYASFEDL